jgi:hypothetical protein
MQAEARPRIASRARPSGSLGGTEQSEAVEVEGETAMDLYMTLQPLSACLRHDEAARR